MSDITRPEIHMVSRSVISLPGHTLDLRLDFREQLIQADRIPGCHIKDALIAFFYRQQRSPDVGLHHIQHVAEIPGRLPISMNLDGLLFHYRFNPFGNDGGIRPLRILTGAIDIEVAQSDRLQAKDRLILGRVATPHGFPCYVTDVTWGCSLRSVCGLKFMATSFRAEYHALVKRTYQGIKISIGPRRARDRPSRQATARLRSPLYLERAITHYVNY